jgi:hypothetical protein
VNSIQEDKSVQDTSQKDSHGTPDAWVCLFKVEAGTGPEIRKNRGNVLPAGEKDCRGKLLADGTAVTNAIGGLESTHGLNVACPARAGLVCPAVRSHSAKTFENHYKFQVPECHMALSARKRARAENSSSLGIRK